MVPSKMKKNLSQKLILNLKSVGEDIGACRRIRKMTQREMAVRMNVSENTIIELEAGNPSIAFSNYLSAAWIMGLEAGLLSAFAPENDPIAVRLGGANRPHRVQTEEDDDDSNFTDISLDF